MPTHSILVVDDDVKLCALLQDYLAQFQFSVNVANDPHTGLGLMQRQQPDLIVLDVMLPEMDGFEVLREIRKMGKVPVIMLTARGEVSDKVVGLELGADDYLAKPFEPRELVARIQTVLRRTQSVPEGSVLDFGDLKLDLDSRSVVHNGHPLQLTTTEFEVLAAFATNPGKVLTRDDLMERLRGIDWDAFNRSIDITVSRLRSKLGDDSKEPRYIKTIWRKGYMFLGQS